MLLLLAALAAAAAAALAVGGGVRAAHLDEFGGLAELHADLLGMLRELRSARDEERHAFGAIDGNETVVAGDGGDDDETTLVVDGGRETDAAAGVFATIQEAVDAAAAGATIVVEPHPNAKGYNENVVIGTAGVTLTSRGAPARMNFAARRCPPARLDGCETRAALFGCDTTVISVRAPDVTVERLTLVHGSIVLGADAQRFTLRQSCVLDTMELGIVTATLDDDAAGGVLPAQGVGQAGDTEAVHVKDATIDANVFAFIGNSNNDAAISLAGDFVTITDNVVMQAHAGIYILGSSATVDNNYVFNTIDLRAIELDDAREGSITHNVVVGVHNDYGIEYRGSSPHITDNVVWGSYAAGIEFRWAHVGEHGGTISHNHIRSVTDDNGMNIFSGGLKTGQLNDLEVSHNSITNVVDRGISLGIGDGTVVANNVISQCETGIQVRALATGSAVRDNVITGASQFGMHLTSGDGMLLTGNKVRQCAVGVGIDEGDEHVLENNTIVKNHGEGVALAAGVRMSSVTGNRIEDNRTDVCSPDAYALEVAMSVAHQNDIGDVGECFVAASVDTDFRRGG